MGRPLTTSALLDTHALLWALTEPTSLSKRARTLILDPSVDLFVSAACAWEIATKARIGKLPQATGLLAGLPRHLIRLGAREIPISMAHAALAGALDWEHRDPFDRVIGAQAMLEGLPLVTRDKAFDSLAGIHVVW